MRFFGQPSWSLNVGGPAGVLEQALYVRDATELPVAAAEGLPGRLVDPDPDTFRLMSERERRTAAQQWLDWWRACLDLTVLRTLEDGPLVDSVWHEELDQAPARVGEAPRWDALADRPELHKAVLLCQGPSEEWRRAQAMSRGRARREQLEDMVEHRVLAALAERVIRDHGVSPDRVKARVLYVCAAGIWWQRVWPGVVVATQGALVDEASYLSLVEDGFVSGL